MKKRPPTGNSGLKTAGGRKTVPLGQIPRGYDRQPGVLEISLEAPLPLRARPPEVEERYYMLPLTTERARSLEKTDYLRIGLS